MEIIFPNYWKKVWSQICLLKLCARHKCSAHRLSEEWCKHYASTAKTKTHTEKVGDILRGGTLKANNDMRRNNTAQLQMWEQDTLNVPLTQGLLSDRWTGGLVLVTGERVGGTGSWPRWLHSQHFFFFVQLRLTWHLSCSHSVLRPSKLKGLSHTYWTEWPKPVSATCTWFSEITG